MKKEDRTTILISRETKSALDFQANRKGETYDQILRRLLTKLGIKFSDDDTIVEGAEDVSH